MRVLAGGACALAMHGAAMAQARTFDIPAGDLKGALDSYIAQSGDQLIFRPEDVRGKRTAGVHGARSAHDALTIILAGTGLRLYRDASGAEVVTVPGPLADRQANDPASTAVEEVVVTAQKRAERLKDVPASVTALTGSNLKDIGAAKLDDYAGLIPGFTVTNASVLEASTQLSIRGVTTGLGGNPTVGIYIDDSPFGASTAFGGYTVPDLDPQDLSRVEVLRGPQGTLYGAGAMGGLLKYVTAEPDPSHFFGRLEIDGSAIDGGGAGYGLRASANIPINQSMALRLSGYDREDPGYIDNVLTGQKDVNGSRFDGGRASFGWQINKDWKVRLSALYQSQTGVGSVVEYNNLTFQPLYGPLKQSNAIGTGGGFQRVGAYSLEIEGRLGDFATLTSSTSYDQQHMGFGLDYTALLSPLISGVFGVPNVGVSLNDSPIDVNKFTQEVRLASPADNKLAWQIGGFYTDETTKILASASTFNQFTGVPVTGLPVFFAALEKPSFEEEAVFGDVTYHFNPVFDVTAGLRYSHNSQESIADQGGLLNGGTSAYDVRSSDDSVTYLVNPRFKLNDDTTVYARFATGYRPGGPNSGLQGTPLTYQPDRVVNYEVGLKNDMFDHKVSLDLSVYWIDWSNIEIEEVSSGGAGYIGNGGTAVSRGVDAAATWRPVAGLSLYANGAYQNAYLTQALPAGGASAAGSGAALPLTPLWSGSVGGDYSFPLFAQWKGQVGGDWRYVDQTMGGFAAAGGVRFVHPSYNLLDLRAGVTNDQWTLMVYAKNIGDDIGQTSDLNLGPFTRVAVLQPRTFEISLSTRF